MKRSLLRIAGAVVAIPIALWVLWFAGAQYQKWRYVDPWLRIKRGETEEHVSKVMGRPDRVTFEHIKYKTWQPPDIIEDDEAESVKQFRYRPFAIAGAEYVVGFDSMGHAVSKFRITSPWGVESGSYARSK